MRGLRKLAARHFERFAADTAHGFGWPIRVVAPGGEFLDTSGFSTDIAQMIDPDTGLAVSGRLASVAIPLRVLSDAFGVLPRRVDSQTDTPWLVEFADVEGAAHTFYVQSSDPDRAIGSLVLMLGAWTDAAD